MEELIAKCIRLILDPSFPRIGTIYVKNLASIEIAIWRKNYLSRDHVCRLDH